MYMQECGPTTSPTLVFLHVGGGAGWMWSPQVESLSRDFHCLVPDLPGHGRSAEMPFTIADAAQQVATLIHTACSWRDSQRHWAVIGRTGAANRIESAHLTPHRPPPQGASNHSPIRENRGFVGAGYILPTLNPLKIIRARYIAPL